MDKAEIPVTGKKNYGNLQYGVQLFCPTSDEEEFDAKTIILATGVEAVRPIKGERELLAGALAIVQPVMEICIKGKR